MNRKTIFKLYMKIITLFILIVLSIITAYVLYNTIKVLLTPSAASGCLGPGSHMNYEFFKWQALYCGIILGLLLGGIIVLVKGTFKVYTSTLALILILASMSPISPMAGETQYSVGVIQHFEGIDPSKVTFVSGLPAWIDVSDDTILDAGTKFAVFVQRDDGAFIAGGILYDGDKNQFYIFFEEVYPALFPPGTWIKNVEFLEVNRRVCLELEWSSGEWIYYYYDYDTDDFSNPKYVRRSDIIGLSDIFGVESDTAGIAAGMQSITSFSYVHADFCDLFFIIGLEGEDQWPGGYIGSDFGGYGSFTIVETEPYNLVKHSIYWGEWFTVQGGVNFPYTLFGSGGGGASHFARPL